MAKGKSNNNYRPILKVVTYVFLIGALGTYFLPVMSVQLPVLGKKSWSVNDIVSVIPKSLPKGGGEQAEKTEKLSIDYDFRDLLKEISPKGEPGKGGAKLSPQIILGALVPAALALAYVLTLISLLLAVLKKCSTFFTASALTAGCAVYALLGTYLLAQEAQKAFSDSVAKVESSPFGAIAKSFVQQVSIQPETGLYALSALTVLVLLIGFYRKSKLA